MNDCKGWDVESILGRIVNTNLFVGKDYTIVITGRGGPTGKSWLCNQLNARGYRAVEITEITMGLLTFGDNVNRMFIDDRQKAVVVILNDILPKYKKGE